MITVVMPVYNGEKYLNETLQSILRQGEAISGILIINDGSTDETEKIIRSWETKEKKISHINKKNEGVAKARNRGLQEVNSRYVWFFDADDIMPAGTAERILEKLEESGADYCIGNCAYYHEGGRIVPTELYVPDHLWKEDRIEIFSWYESPGNKVFRTEFLKENHINFPSYKIAEDTSFCSKCVVKSSLIVSISDCIELYRIYDGSSSHRYNSTVLDKLKAFAEIRAYLKENGMGEEWFARQTYNELYHYKVVFKTLPLYSDKKERVLIENKFEEAFYRLNLDQLKHLKEYENCQKYIKEIRFIVMIKSLYMLQPVSWMLRTARRGKQILRRIMSKR